MSPVKGQPLLVDLDALTLQASSFAAVIWRLRSFITFKVLPPLLLSAVYPSCIIQSLLIEHILARLSHKQN